MAAFSLAKDLLADSLELDARICGSGEVVVFHDETLDALTGASGRVAETPLSRLRELRVRGEPIPTLEEVLRSDARPRGIVIELKTDRFHETALAGKVAKLIDATRAMDRGPVTVSSFNPLTLRVLRGKAKHVRRALLAHAELARPLRELWFARTVAPAELHLEGRMITPRTIAKARHAGRAVVAWTVNDPEEARRLQTLGVDGLITDVPDRVRAAVKG